MYLKWIKLAIFEKDWIYLNKKVNQNVVSLVCCNLCCDFNDWCNEQVYGKMDELSKGMTQTGSTATTDKIQENNGKHFFFYHVIYLKLDSY